MLFFVWRGDTPNRTAGYGRALVARDYLDFRGTCSEELGSSKETERRDELDVQGMTQQVIALVTCLDV